jgi:hypothetical protein
VVELLWMCDGPAAGATAAPLKAQLRGLRWAYNTTATCAQASEKQELANHKEASPHHVMMYVSASSGKSFELNDQA